MLVCNNIVSEKVGRHRTHSRVDKSSGYAEAIRAHLADERLATSEDSDVRNG